MIVSDRYVAARVTKCGKTARVPCRADWSTHFDFASAVNGEGAYRSEVDRAEENQLIGAGDRKREYRSVVSSGGPPSRAKCGDVSDELAEIVQQIYLNFLTCFFS